MNGGGFGSRRRGGCGTLSEINVTPFVDVVLVLLIIFMLTAHVMEFGIEVDVPKVRYVQGYGQGVAGHYHRQDGRLRRSTARKSTSTTVDPRSIRQKFPSAKGVYVRADRETIWDPDRAGDGRTGGRQASRSTW